MATHKCLVLGFKDLNWRALRNCDRSQDTHTLAIHRSIFYLKKARRVQSSSLRPWLSRLAPAARACCCFQLLVLYRLEVVVCGAKASQNSAMSLALHQRVQLCSPLRQPRQLQQTQTLRYPCVLTPRAARGNRQGVSAAAVDVMNLLTHQLVPKVIVLATRCCA